MASRSLGSLTVDLVLKMGGFRQGATQAERAVDNLARKTRNTLRTVQGVVAGLAGAIGFQRIVQATVEAERAQAKLAQTLKSTGGVVGFTSKQLQAMASQFQDVTAYGDDAVLAMQAVLLTFTNVRGDQFTQATEAVLDLATALNMDLQSAALLVGKALNDPVKGATALRRSGIQLSESQKELIERFVETGEVAKAQGIIIEELGRQFGGQARALRDTFGGAIEAVKNALGDLLEVETGIPGVVSSLNDLEDVLRDPQTRAAADSLFSGLIVGAGKAVEFITQTIGVVRELAHEAASIRFGPAAGDMVRIEEEIARVQAALATSSGNPLERLRFFGREGVVEWWSDEELRAELKRLQGLLDQYGASGALASPAKIAPTLTDAPYNVGGGDDDEAAKRAAKERADLLRQEADAYKDILNAGMAAIDGLKTPLEQQIEQYHEAKFALEQLAATYPNLADQAQDALRRLEVDGLEDIAITAEKILPPKEVEKVSEFAEEAKRNTQDILADFLVDPLSGGLDGLIVDFARMFQQIAAQALAAKIADKLFSGIDGWLDKLGGLFSGGGGGFLSGLGSLFGFADGGFTGFGGKYEPAGIVHRGEGVLSQGEVRALGGPGGFMALREAIRELPGFAAGGLVGSTPRAPSLPARAMAKPMEMPAPQVNLRNINAFDTGVIRDYLLSASGEEVLMNFVNRNGARVRAATVGG